VVTRRLFLGSAGAGAAVLADLCKPPAWAQAAGGGLAEKARLKPLKRRVLGYPINMNTPSDDFFAWRHELFDVGVNAFAFNNVGNPFRPSPIPYNTHDLERETIISFARTFAFQADDAWGFVSHSGTDSNMHGMYLGKTLLKGRTGKTPKAYFTREAHYSVQILRDLLGLEAVDVATLTDGSMDAGDLARKLVVNGNDPALVVATVGTTFKGAVDDVDAIRQALTGRQSYLHVDAALFGGYLPFTSSAATVQHRGGSAAGGRYDSIAVSCHKFFGFPTPAGLFVTTRRLYDEFNAYFSKIHNPEYIHQVPGTITCSRDSVKPAEFHYFTRPSVQKRLAADAAKMLENTAFFVDEMRRRFTRLNATRSNPLSNTVYFRHPGDDIVRKYSLATMQVELGGRREKYAHVIVMPHVTRDVIAEFLADLGSS